MKQMNKHLKTQTTALNLFMQSLLSIVMGVILIYNYNWFFTRVSMFVFAYFWFVLALNVIGVLRNMDRMVKDVIQELVPFLGFGVAIAIYYSNINRIILLIPPIMLCSTFIMAVSSFISFMQYRKEISTAPARYLIATILHLGFGVFFTLYTYRFGYFFTGIRLIGIYLVLLGIMLFFDGLAKAIPNKYIVKWTKRIRITPPALIVAFVPLALLNKLNDYFKENEEPAHTFKVEKGQKQANVEVYVHVSKTMRGIAGHVDIAIDDTIVCYGTYDRESIHLGGIIGSGVIYEVYDKEAYLAFCNTVRKETVFEYGLTFTETELNAIREKLEEMKSRASVWKCKAQREMEAGREILEPKDMSCKLAKAMKTVFYKFNSGSYKYYWMFGSNCVSFTDELLKASGMKTVLAGIITPGTYFIFLNDEFAKGNPKIVSRTVYLNAVE